MKGWPGWVVLGLVTSFFTCGDGFPDQSVLTGPARCKASSLSEASTLLLSQITTGVVQKKKKKKKSKDDKERKSKKKKSKKKEDGEQTKVERRPFDRDKDLAIPKMDDAQRKSVISRSKELGGRFGHGGTQFLWLSHDVIPLLLPSFRFSGSTMLVGNRKRDLHPGGSLGLRLPLVNKTHVCSVVNHADGSCRGMVLPPFVCVCISTRCLKNWCS